MSHTPLVEVGSSLTEINNQSLYKLMPAGVAGIKHYFIIRNNSYHIECQSSEDGTIAIRMLEYDFFIGLRNAIKYESDKYKVTLPKSVIIYLRSSEKTKDSLTVCIENGHERCFDYTIDVIKADKLTVQDIIKYNLYMFLPFYGMRYEKEKERLESDDNMLHRIVCEYNNLIDGFDKVYYNMASRNGINVTLEIKKLIERIVKYVFQNQDKVQQEIGGVVMGGKALKLISEELAEKEEELARQNKKLAEKDEELAKNKEQMARDKEEIARLKALLEEKQSK